MRKKHYNLLESFGFALKGLCLVFKKERNFKIHCLAASLMILIAIFLNFNYLEWLVLFLIIAMVMAAEVFNSAIEGICDLVRDKLKLGYQETASMRNFSAGAVFLIACFAVIIGFILVIHNL